MLPKNGTILKSPVDILVMRTFSTVAAEHTRKVNEIIQVNISLEEASVTALISKWNSRKKTMK